MRHPSTRRSNLVCLAARVAARSRCPPRRAAAEGDKADPKVLAFFESEVRPLLAANCYKCHSSRAARSPRAGSCSTAARGCSRAASAGRRSCRATPGEPADPGGHARDDKLQMPPKKELSEEQVADARASGSSSGRPGRRSSRRRPAARGRGDGKYAEVVGEVRADPPGALGVSAGARRPRRRRSRTRAGRRRDIDRFILAKLEEHELKPSQPADRRTLIRRATFDLTGLPPTPEEVEAFVNDTSPKAFEKVVDRLLASPAFGERWGRHWLDVARYAESTGMTPQRAATTTPGGTATT